MAVFGGSGCASALGAVDFRPVNRTAPWRWRKRMASVVGCSAWLRGIAGL